MPDQNYFPKITRGDPDTLSIEWFFLEGFSVLVPRDLRVIETSGPAIWRCKFTVYEPLRIYSPHKYRFKVSCLTQRHFQKCKASSNAAKRINTVPHN